MPESLANLMNLLLGQECDSKALSLYLLAYPARQSQSCGVKALSIVHSHRAYTEFWTR